MYEKIVNVLIVYNKKGKLKHIGYNEIALSLKSCDIFHAVVAVVSTVP